MNEANTKQDLENELNEADVAAYLEAHPDFLQRHAGALQALELRHQSGAAVSLIERQVESLRSANQQIQARLNELIDTARDNELRVAHLNSLARALIAADSPASLLEELRACLHRELAVDELFLGIVGGKEVEQGGIQAMTQEGEQMQAVTNVFRRGKPICGPLSDEQIAALFAASGDTPPRSAAMVPLGQDKVRGVLVLGSRDSKRFVPEMGTLFLDLMGQLVTAACRRHLGAGCL